MNFKSTTDYHNEYHGDVMTSQYRFKQAWDSIETPVQKFIEENLPTKWGSPGYRNNQQPGTF